MLASPLFKLIFCPKSSGIYSLEITWHTNFIDPAFLKIYEYDTLLCLLQDALMYPIPLNIRKIEIAMIVRHSLFKYKISSMVSN